MARSDDDWLAGLASRDSAERAATTGDLADFIRRTLGRGFGRQLDDATLDDLAQDTMVRVHDKLDSYAGRSRFTTWAAAIASNLALGELRRRRYEHVSFDDAVAEGREQLSRAGVPALAPAEAPGRLQRSQLVGLLHQAIDEALTTRQRDALHAELSGMPAAEIARRLGSSRGALYKLLHDARKRLRAYLEERGVDITDLGVAGHPGSEALV